MCRQGDDSVQLKLFGRLRCCCQLEVLLEVLLQVGGLGWQGQQHAACLSRWCLRLSRADS